MEEAPLGHIIPIIRQTASHSSQHNPTQLHPETSNQPEHKHHQGCGLSAQ